jgi:hypothetical protein
MAGMAKLANVSDLTPQVADGYILGDATSRVAPASNESVSSANNVLVKEACRPDLARHKGSAENANEETDEIQSHSVVGSAS